MQAWQWNVGLTLGLIVAGSAAGAAGGSPNDNVWRADEMTIEDLLNVDIGAATKTTKPLRESPGIVTVVSREEIRDAGSRDLVDVLRLVPGFDFGVDVQGQIGVGFRGMWAQEGKVLLLVDGQELNEGMYLGTQFGNHVPVDQIERIEIVRGPGSVIYGGNAELAVINIVTQSGEAIGGARVSAMYGQMARDFGRRDLSLQLGKRFASGVDVSLSGFVGEGNRSDYVYRDFEDNRYRMNDNAELNPMYANLGINYQKLALRFIYDNYRTTERDAFDIALGRAYQTDFVGMYADASYGIELAKGLTLTPRLTFKRQMPWRALDKATEAYDSIFYDKRLDRTGANLLLSWDLAEGVNVLVGGVATFDHAVVQSNPGAGINALFGDSRTVSYENYAAFAQLLYDTPIVNLSAGARYEHHSHVGPSFVPRVGLTKVIDKLHFKLLYSEAFKAPGIENINLSPDVEPERTRAIEGEVGYQIGEHFFAGLNAYDVTIEEPIVYTYDDATDTDTESYANFSRTGTRGVDLDGRWRFGSHYATLTYSFYAAAGKNEIEKYAVPDNDNALLALPQHKVTLVVSYELVPGLSVNPSMMAIGERYGYLSVDAPGGTELIGKEDATVLANLYVRYRVAGLEGLELGLGVFNIFGEKYRFLQPYDGYHAPYPGQSREVLARVSYVQPF